MKLLRHLPVTLLALIVIFPFLPILAVMQDGGTLTGAALLEPKGWWRQLRLLGNTLYVGAGAALLSLCLATIPAWAAARYRHHFLPALILVAAIAPLMIPPAVHAVAAVRLFKSAAFVYTLSGTAVVLAWAFFPIAFLILRQVFRLFDPEIEESALLEAPWWQVLLRLVLPITLGGFAIGFLVIALLSITEFGVPEALRSQPVLVSDVYVQFGVAYDVQGAFRASLLLGIPVLVMLIPLLITHGGAMERQSGLEDMRRGTHRASRILCPKPLAIVGAIIAFIPISILLAVLLTSLTGPSGRIALLRMTWAITQEEFFHTIKLALVGAFSCVIVGALAGYLLSRVRRVVFWRVLLLLAFLIPGPVIGVAWKLALLRDPASIPESIASFLYWLDGTPIPLILAWTGRFFPIVALLVEHRLRSLPLSWLDALRMDASRWQFLWSVSTLPQVFAALLLGGGLCFALIAGETGAAVLLIPPGTSTLSVRLMTLMHYAPAGQVSALCLYQVLLSVTALPMLWFFFRDQTRSQLATVR